MATIRFSSMPKHPLSRLILLFAILFGALVRLYPAWSAGFPVNDGGMFYRMVQDLIASGFRIPLYTTYNQLTIPFAYPPLPFFVAGFLNRSLQLPLMDILRWFPALVSVLTIPAFFWLARLLLLDDTRAAIAVLFFAFMPRSFEWLIMGGGLTRAPATLFFILFAGYLIRAFRDQDRKAVWYAILCGGAVLLSHPERSLHALMMGILFLIFFVRTKRGWIDALTIGAGAALISTPWWALDLVRFGVGPFLQASRAGGDRALFWSPLLLLNITDETIAMTALLGVIGIMFELSKRRWLLPVWVLLTFITDPRSAPHIAPIQFSLLAGIALVDVLLPALSTKFEGDSLLDNKIGKMVVTYFLIVGLVNGLLSAFTLSGIRLSVYEREALTWISQNVQTSGQTFLIYPRESDSALSPLLEWFPALTSQTSLSTYQGREWLTGRLHSDAFSENRKGWLACANQGEQCLEDWISSGGEDVGYVLVSSKLHELDLSRSLRGSSNYVLVYQNAEVEIFQRTH